MNDDEPWRAGPVVTQVWQRGEGASFVLSQARHAQTVMLALLAARGTERPVVWLPAFYAVSSMAPLLRADVDVQLYPMTPKLAPDWAALDAMARLAPPQLIVLGHFYGTEVDGAPARALADRHGALLLEDAAHTMLPAGGIGQYGHFTCYSPRKFYGTGDGAVLVANGAAPAAEVEAVAPDILSQRHTRRGYRLKVWGDRHLPWRRRRGALPELDFDHDWNGEPSASPSVWMSPGTRARIERLGVAGAEAIRAREVGIAAAIERHVEAATSLDALPRRPEIAPYLLGFRGRDRAEAEAAYRLLRAAGATAGTWPDLPRRVREHPERYGAALELRNTIVRVIPRFTDRRSPLEFVGQLPAVTA